MSSLTTIPANATLNIATLNITNNIFSILSPGDQTIINGNSFTVTLANPYNIAITWVYSALPNGVIVTNQTSTAITLTCTEVITSESITLYAKSRVQQCTPVTFNITVI